MDLHAATLTKQLRAEGLFAELLIDLG